MEQIQEMHTAVLSGSFIMPSSYKIINIRVSKTVVILMLCVCARLYKK